MGSWLQEGWGNMVSKKKTRAHAKRLQTKTVSEELETAALPKLPSTFSTVDGLGNGKDQPEPQSIDTQKLILILDKIEKAITQNTHISVTIEDTRDDPAIHLHPSIDVRQPSINVEPTPIVNKILAPKFPEIRPPRVEVKNDLDITPICWIGGFIALLLLFDLVLKIWQSQTL